MCARDAPGAPTKHARVRGRASLVAAICGQHFTHSGGVNASGIAFQTQVLFPTACFAARPVFSESVCFSDLPCRLQQKLPVTPYARAAFWGGNEKRHSDFLVYSPTVEAAEQTAETA